MWAEAVRVLLLTSEHSRTQLRPVRIRWTGMRWVCLSPNQSVSQPISQSVSQSVSQPVSQIANLSVTVLKFSGMDARDSLDSVYVAVKVYRPRGRELAIADPLGTGRDGTGIEWGMG